MEAALTNLALSAVFAVLGFILLFAGYRIFDGLISDNVGEQIFAHGNVAAAIVAAGFVIGLAIIIAAAIA